MPGFGSEWYPRKMYQQGTPEFEHHVATYGPQSKFGYKDFIPLFKAEKFDAGEWAKLFKEAGAKYVVPVAEHHDGFPMYDSDLTDWCAAKQGPKRDVIGELADAFRKEGIVVGASSHRAEHWWFFDQGMYFDSDVRDGANAALYGPASNQRTAESQSEPPDQAFLDDWLLRSCEIVDKYQPQVVYFDWWICQPVFQPYLQRFAAYYYNRGAEWGKPVAINFKEWEGRSFPDGTGVFDIERGQSADIRPDFWQTCTSVSKNSWGYIANQDYKDVGDIVDDLIDITSKNGTMLLNIGPKPDGTIPEKEQEMLRAIGGWLAVNGEAIYGTRPWKQVRRRADANRRRLVRRREASALHRRRFPFHYQGRHALRHRAGVARQRTAGRKIARGRRPRGKQRRTARLRWQTHVETNRRGRRGGAPHGTAMRLRRHAQNRFQAV